MTLGHGAWSQRFSRPARPNSVNKCIRCLYEYCPCELRRWPNVPVTFNKIDSLQFSEPSSAKGSIVKQRCLDSIVVLLNTMPVRDHCSLICTGINIHLLAGFCSAPRRVPFTSRDCEVNIA